MPSAIVIALEHPGVLLGVEDVTIIVDGVARERMQFNDVISVEVDPGIRMVAVMLHGVVDRVSNILRLNVPQDGYVRLTGKYNRWTGAIQLKL